MEFSERPSHPHFTADRPISALDEDSLGRGHFCLGLANAISSWRGKESLVIGLYGAWGSGKSSVKNIVIDLLRRAEPPVSVLEFNPWSWPNPKSVGRAFLDEVGRALERESKSGKELSEKWKLYANRLALTATTFKFVKYATIVTGHPILTVMAGAGEIATKKGSTVLEQAGEAVDVREESISELKGDIRRLLQELPRPLLIVIDDIDRLSKVEIRSLFRLVKASTDFPQLIFLMLYDRKVVELSLQEISGTTGKDFMEKIVQVGVDLPSITQDKLVELFSKGLDSIINSYPKLNLRLETERWPEVLHEGIAPFLKTMRDVGRLLAVFGFTLGLFIKNDQVEVNVIDLIAMETLRVFEPNIYNSLYYYYEILVDDYVREFITKITDQAREERFKKLLTQADENARERVQKLLIHLFPRLAVGGSNNEMDYERLLRICSRRMFSRYFILTLPEGELPLSVIRGVLDACNTLEGARQSFEGIRSNGTLRLLVQRLDAYKTEIAVESVGNLVTGMFDVGNELEESQSIFEVGSAVHAYRIIHFGLLSIKDARHRSKVLLAAIDVTTGLFLPVEVVLREIRRRASDSSNVEFLLDSEDLVAARELCAKMLSGAAAQGRLTEYTPKLGFYLRAWKLLGGKGLTEHVATVLSSPQGARAFLRSLTGEIQSSGPIKRRLHVRLSSIEEFVPVERLIAAVGEQFAAAHASATEATLKDPMSELTALHAALKRRAAKISDDDINWEEEDRMDDA